jgi:RNA polymerase-binding transcription factor DksA
MPKTDEHPAATAADILARGPEAPSIDPRWQKYFDRLNRLREYIAQQRSTQIANAHTGEPVSGANPADRGTDEYDMGAALSLISSEQNALFEIDQAIRRIRDGTYGICEATRKPIPAERLDAVPWTRFARDIEEKLEREQQSRKPRHVL